MLQSYRTKVIERLFMKKILIVTTFLLTTFLIACNSVSLSDIESNFELCGYYQNDDMISHVPSVVALLDEFEEEGIRFSTSLYAQSTNLAILIKFSKTKDLEYVLENSETLDNLIVKVDKEELVIGNILLLPMNLTSNSVMIGNMVEIFHGDLESNLVETTTLSE